MRAETLSNERLKAPFEKMDEFRSNTESETAKSLLECKTVLVRAIVHLSRLTLRVIEGLDK